MQLTETDIIGASYIEPGLVDIYTTKSKEPIQYILKDGRFEPQQFYMRNGKPDRTFWKYKFDIYENKDIHSFLENLNSKDLWTEKLPYIKTYIKSAPRSNVPNTSRKRSVYNKNGKLLPVGWHRISERGKSWFQGPRNNERYNNINYYYTNKNKSRVKNRTYKVKEGNDTFYILPDGTLSWHPYKVPAA